MTQPYKEGTIVVLLYGDGIMLGRISERVNQLSSIEPMWEVKTLGEEPHICSRVAEHMRPATKAEIEAGQVLEKYCQMCGSTPPQPGLIFCEYCYLAYEGIHAFLREMEGYLSPQVKEAIKKAPFQFHSRLGVPYQPPKGKP